MPVPPRLFRTFVAVALLAIAPSFTRVDGQLPVPPTGTTLLRNVTVIDPATGRATPGQSVLIEGRHITAVGPVRAVSAPKGGRVLDLAGQFVIPGLIDAHSHVFGFRPQRPGSGPDFDSSWEYFAGLELAYGVTSVRLPAANVARMLKIRRELASGTTIGPRFWMAAFKLGDQEVVPGAPDPLRTPADAARAVRMMKDAGAEIAKFNFNLPADQWRAAAREAKRVGLPIESHVPTEITLEEAADSGLSVISHMFLFPMETSGQEDWLRKIEAKAAWPRLYEKLQVKLRLHGPFATVLQRSIATHSRTRADSLWQHLKRRGVWVTPTLALHAVMEKEDLDTPLSERLRLLKDEEDFDRMSKPEKMRQSAQSDAYFAFLLALVREMHEAGIPLMVGSDAPTLNPPGLSMHDEMALFVRAGFTPAEALRAATSDAARFLKADSLGVVRAGAVADLVVLRENPLQQIRATRSIAWVMSDGRLLDRATMDRMVERSATLAKRERDLRRVVATLKHP